MLEKILNIEIIFVPVLMKHCDIIRQADKFKEFQLAEREYRQNPSLKYRTMSFKTRTNSSVWCPDDDYVSVRVWNC